MSCLCDKHHLLHSWTDCHTRMPVYTLLSVSSVRLWAGYLWDCVKWGHGGASTSLTVLRSGCCLPSVSRFRPYRRPSRSRDRSLVTHGHTHHTTTSPHLSFSHTHMHTHTPTDTHTHTPTLTRAHTHTHTHTHTHRRISECAL